MARKLSCSSNSPKDLTGQDLPGEERLADAAAPRPFGLRASDFAVPEDFDAPLPESVLRDFEAAFNEESEERAGVPAKRRAA